jgi:hypothetical protein
MALPDAIAALSPFRAFVNQAGPGDKQTSDVLYEHEDAFEAHSIASNSSSSKSDATVE